MPGSLNVSPRFNVTSVDPVNVISGSLDSKSSFFIIFTVLYTVPSLLAISVAVYDIEYCPNLVTKSVRLKVVLFTIIFPPILL